MRFYNMDNTNPTFKLELTLEAVKLVLAGLGELPLKMAGGLHQHIVDQVNAQAAEQQATEEVTE